MPATLKLEKTPQSWMNRFFAGQSKVMWAFFAVTFATMLVLLILGRRLYLQMYRRH